MEFALNHVTAANANLDGLLSLAQQTGCVGIELRNDLGVPLFGNIAPSEAGKMIRDHGLRLLSVAEIKAFNDWNDDKAKSAGMLIDQAKAANSEAVSLIPRNDNSGLGNGEWQAQLRVALKEIAPMLRDAGLVGFIEPLGFGTCALRHKNAVMEVVEALEMRDCIKIIHDTFHHFLSSDSFCASYDVGLVHISGVAQPGATRAVLSDEMRGLVDQADALGNLEQIRNLEKSDLRVPYSFEAFAPTVQEDDRLAEKLVQSMEFIRSGLSEMAA